jgi:hypothetical protein
VSFLAQPTNVSFEETSASIASDRFWPRLCENADSTVVLQAPAALRSMQMR